jgi:UDPglucose 6-dehydrogenase
LLNKGVSIQGFDPQAMKTSREEIPEPVLCQNPYNIAEGTDTIPLANEWNESKLSDFKRIKANMRGRMIVDGRNIWGGSKLHALGFNYFGMCLSKPE